MPDFSEHRLHLEILLHAALRAADPAEAVRNGWPANDLTVAERIFLISTGKAAVAMAEAAAAQLGQRLTAGIIAAPSMPIMSSSDSDSRLTGVAAGHPQPNAGSLFAGALAAECLAQTTEHDQVIALISGGGSALLEHLVPGLSLEQLQQITSTLMRAGATINELNCVRKHLSQLKGGGLARLAAPARVLTLILSDVIGDPLDVIASGPTVPDPTTVPMAATILEKYGLLSLSRCLHETPKPGDPIFNRVTNRLIGSNLLARQAAAQAATELGFRVYLPPMTVEGEARHWAITALDISTQLINAAGDQRPSAVIFGGETTVTVRGTGVGGRNQELALAAALALEGDPRRFVIASFGTDGIDGPTPAAGAFATPQTCARARALGLDPRAMLANNDSHTFFKALGGPALTPFATTRPERHVRARACADYGSRAARGQAAGHADLQAPEQRGARTKEDALGDCFMTGLTGTNVNDLVIGLVY